MMRMEASARLAARSMLKLIRKINFEAIEWWEKFRAEIENYERGKMEWGREKWETSEFNTDKNLFRPIISPQ